MREIEKKSFLKGISEFKSFTEEEIEKLSNLFIEEKYDKDKYIWREGEACRYVYFVYKGRIKRIKHSPSGRDIIVDILQPGNIFGLMAFLSEEPFPVSAIACEPSIILKIAIGHFLNLEKKFPGLTSSMAKTLAIRLMKASEIIQTVAVEKVEVRIARVLLKLFNEQTFKGRDPISITRQELADMVGTTVETSIRTISKFKRKGLITSKRGKIWIKNIPALEKITTGENV
ncbi:MAG: Crp/Fnr family transcriptional regulator [Nitrospinae bacterium]|nr:Crp/Fnr family transcriptional regulator [Nitrospinota bacterium]